MYPDAADDTADNPYLLWNFKNYKWNMNPNTDAPNNYALNDTDGNDAPLTLLF